MVNHDLGAKYQIFYSSEIKLIWSSCTLRPQFWYVSVSLLRELCNSGVLSVPDLSENSLPAAGWLQWYRYSQSDSSLATPQAFSILLWQNVRVFHPKLANILGALLLLRVCINILFVSTPQNVDFAHLIGPIIKCAHWQQYDVCLVIWSIVRNIQTREIVLSSMCTFYNRN